METTKVTIGTKIRKEIATLLLRMISLQISMNMEMNSTTQMELHTIEDLQEENGVNLKIEINPVHATGKRSLTKETPWISSHMQI